MHKKRWLPVTPLTFPVGTIPQLPTRADSEMETHRKENVLAP